MIRSLTTIGLLALIVLVWACNGGADEPSPTATSGPLPTLTPTPTPTPLDPNVGCAPPLSERHCAETYRPPPASCRVSGVWQLRASGLWGIGEPPVWMVSTAPVGTLLKPEPRSMPEAGGKTIWIVDDSVEGEVRLTGRRLDGPGVAEFPLYERDGTVELNAAGDFKREWGRTELVLVPPHGRFSEHRTEVYAPGPGCWQFTARTETETVEIVLYHYPAEEPPD